MDLIMKELEFMAKITMERPMDDGNPDTDTIKRWQKLFGYSFTEAHKKLQAHRQNISPRIIPEGHWSLVRAEKEAEGHDKESYEHACDILRRHPQPASPALTLPKSPNFLVKMEGPIHSLEMVKAISGKWAENVTRFVGVDDAGDPTVFFLVDARAIERIFAWLTETNSTFQPTFIPCSLARKELSYSSRYPTLGIDATLPQYRLQSDTVKKQKTSMFPLQDTCVYPLQDTNPLFYFFYGTLADAAVLGRVLNKPKETIAYQRARVSGGMLTTWGGKYKRKYKALVDSTEGNNVVEGSVYLVYNPAQEMALRCYETHRYEVVRCQIEILDSDGTAVTVPGLTFRFIL
ncbi:hypothetical protein QBC47DRAFT_311191 [Echria macrotheca]|uniref:Putative gamma-glutamylcyclotransferase n=1 Tax=Echria macrotheca TaxID=438768 RepID=A0AAJ0B2R2_9PEZI|nr:hypothetical protein QBC47DRAFT_311191 [Echria macrotheca]